MSTEALEEIMTDAATDVDRSPEAQIAVLLKPGRVGDESLRKGALQPV